MQNPPAPTPGLAKRPLKAGAESSPSAGWRADFPIFVDRSLIYLDSAASAQKPQVVIDALNEFYSSGYSNIHRGIYKLSEQATLRYDRAREAVARFIGAASPRETIFTHGTTEALNLVAHSLGETLSSGDEIIVSILEHHANFVPWQMLAERKNLTLRFVGLDANGQLDFAQFESFVNARTKAVAITHLSNACGIAPPLKRMIMTARDAGAVTIVDGAQGVCHLPLNVSELGADFYAFSGHKLYGPTGIGVLYGREELLEKLPPFMGGGDMISSVSVLGTSYNELPHKFEAGTPHIAGAIGLHAALNYVNSIGLEKIYLYEHALLAYLEKRLAEIEEVHIVAKGQEHHGLVAFSFDGVHPHDLSQFLSSKNICVRAGHHCAQPLLEHLGLASTTRVSLGLYNEASDIDALIAGLIAARDFFKV